MAPRVVVFIDYENMLRSAHELWCGPDERLYESLVDPLKLAKCLVRKRPPGGELQEVRVYRGRPDPRKERQSASYNDKQKMAWEESDSRVTVIRRMLSYSRDWPREPPQEKGIDVSIAIDLVSMSMAREFDVGILFCRDTDLLPALERIRDVNGAHVELSGWEGASRLRLESKRPLWSHQLSENNWVSVRDTRSYHILGDGSVPRVAHP